MMTAAPFSNKFGNFSEAVSGEYGDGSYYSQSELDSVVSKVISSVVEIIKSNEGLKLSSFEYSMSMEESRNEKEIEALEKNMEALSTLAKKKTGQLISKIATVFSVVVAAVSFVVAPNPLSLAALISSSVMLVDMLAAEACGSYDGITAEVSQAVMEGLQTSGISEGGKIALSVLASTACMIAILGVSFGAGAAMPGSLAKLKTMVEVSVKENLSTMVKLNDGARLASESLQSVGRAHIGYVGKTAAEYEFSAKEIEAFINVLSHALEDVQVSLQESENICVSLNRILDY